MSIETPSKEMKQEMKKINEAIRSTLDYKIVKDSCLRGTEKERWDQWAFDITDQDMPQKVYL